MRVVEGDRPVRLAVGADVGLTDAAWLLMESCWAANPTLRPSVDFVYNSLRKISSGGVLEVECKWPTDGLEALERWKVSTLVRILIR